MKRVLISGIVAGIAFFIWLSLVHLATPLGQVGLKSIAHEDDVLRAIKASIPESGFYFFPGAPVAKGASSAERKAAMNAAMEKMKTSPTGIMVVFPNGKPGLTPAQLVTELLNDILQGLIVAWLIWNSMETTMSGRVRYALLIGVAAAMVTNVSYWNWYGFPTDYTLAYIFGQVTGYAAMGAAIAITLGKGRAEIAST